MVKTLEAVFDGKVLRPDQPLKIRPNTRVRLTVETIQPTAPNSVSFLATARALELYGPSDWSFNLDLSL